MTNFFDRIKKMNRTFKVHSESLNNLGGHRLVQFKRIIMDEISEVDEIIEESYTREQRLVMVADWLGDLIVYAASEAGRWGIDIESVLTCIMDSQDSKLGIDGQPIMCPKTNKFLKGPNYQPPEPMIKQVLFGDDDGKEKEADAG